MTETNHGGLREASARPLPKAVLFDLFHTTLLVNPRSAENVRDGHGYSWEELGVERDAWEREFYADHAGRAVGRTRDPVESMRIVVHAIDPTIPIERIRTAMERRMIRFDRAFAAPDPRIVSSIARLRDAGCRICLVSNAAFDEIEGWRTSPLSAPFHDAVFSCEVGVAKPDRRIYEIALERTGVAPNEAVFVGDGGADEHRGAKALGIRAVLVEGWARTWWPAAIETRRSRADEIHEDVPAFVDSLLGPETA